MGLEQTPKAKESALGRLVLDALTDAKIAREIFKQGGAWAIFSIAACAALYFFTLKPAADERQVFVEVLRTQAAENRQSIKAIEAAVTKIAEAADKQNQAVESIDRAIKAQQNSLTSIESAILELRRESGANSPSRTGTGG